MGFSREFVLKVADRPAMKRFITTRAQGIVRRFVAGDQFEDAARVLEKLSRDGLDAILDLLGESVGTDAEADEARDTILTVLSGTQETGRHPDLAVKLTQIGLKLDFDRCLLRLRAILEKAQEAGVFVWIDMEESQVTEDTLRMFEAVRPDHPGVGIVLQAYLYRTGDDLERLLPLKPKIRIVKGAYLEPPDIAFPEKARVDANYRVLLKRCLDAGTPVAAATHDESLIHDARAYAESAHAGPDRFEFQMLYGIRPDLQRSLVRDGYRVLVYIPFGTSWYEYFARRLAERPANLWFVLRSLVRS